MKNMKKRVLVTLAALFLMAGSVVTASAATCGVSKCNSSVSTYYQGSTLGSYTHKYGGFAGLFQKTCSVATISDKYAEICSSGHINGYITITGESHSDWPDCQ